MLFDFAGNREAATYFTGMTLASHNQRERGHAGHFFSWQWGALGAARGGPAAAQSFVANTCWFTEMERLPHCPYGEDGFPAFVTEGGRSETEVILGNTLVAKTRTADQWSEKWRVKMPMTGKAMILAKDAVFVIGAPLVFPHDDLGGTYAGRQGAIMGAVAAADGATLAEYKLDQLPVWDGVAAASGRVFIVDLDGGVACWGR